MSAGLFEMLGRKPAPARTDKQRQLIRSAIELFSERGFSNTTTAQIAERAGVSEGMIFKYYGTKDRLLLSLIVSFVKDFSPEATPELLEQLQPADADVDFEQFVGRVVRDRVAFVRAHRDVFQVLVKEIVYSDDLRAELLDHVCGNLVATAAAAGGAGAVVGDEFARAFVADFAGFLIGQYVIADRDEIPAADVEDFVRLLVAKIRRNSTHL